MLARAEHMLFDIVQLAILTKHLTMDGPSQPNLNGHSILNQSGSSLHNHCCSVASSGEPMFPESHFNALVVRPLSTVAPLVLLLGQRTILGETLAELLYSVIQILCGIWI